MKLLKFFIYVMVIFIIGFSEQSDPCAKSWQILKDPRLDVIADNIANLKAKISSGNGTQSDSQEIYRLKEEEKRIWDSASNACK